MCAIAGEISTTPIHYNEETYTYLDKMLETMRRRGPDATGTVFYTHAALLHARLSVIDPEGGALEMIVKDKSQVGGPLNQFSTVGYKFETNGATVLYPERVLRIMSCSSFSDVDDAN